MSPASTEASRYVAFLRAINVGGHNVKMGRLREVFESLGLGNVETFIARGNVIFEPPHRDSGSLEREIERALRETLGYEVATFVRTIPEVAGISTYQPFAPLELEGNSLYIAFLSTRLDEDLPRELVEFRDEINDFHAHGREVYWLCRGKISESGFSGALLEKALGMPTTVRNANTIRRLAAKYPAGG